MTKLERLEARCRDFNHKYPIGTLVNFHPVIRDPKFRQGRTASEAYVLSGHTCVIYLDTESGCVAIEALTFPNGEIAKGIE